MVYFNGKSDLDIEENLPGSLILGHLQLTISVWMCLECILHVTRWWYLDVTFISQKLEEFHGNSIFKPSISHGRMGFVPGKSDYNARMDY